MHTLAVQSIISDKDDKDKGATSCVPKSLQAWQKKKGYAVTKSPKNCDMQIENLRKSKYVLKRQNTSTNVEK